jgi:hypothetical protein
MMIFPLLLAAAVEAGTPATPPSAASNAPPSIVFEVAPSRIVTPGTVSVTTNIAFEAAQRVTHISGAVVGQQYFIQSSDPAWKLASAESETPDICTISNGNMTAFGFPGAARIVAHFTNASGATATATAERDMRLLSAGATNVTLLGMATASLANAIFHSFATVTNGLTPLPPESPAYNIFSSQMIYSFGQPPPDPKWSNWVYTRNTNFWLNGVGGLDALNVFPYQMELTLVTPRHCLTVEHMRGCGSNYMICFVGTNNTIYWRRSLGTLAIGDRLRACILDAPVPITPMPLFSADALTTRIGMLRRTDDLRSNAHSLPVIMFNQRWQAWVGDAVFASAGFIVHEDRSMWFNGWSWAVSGPAVVGGDSGSARCLLIGHQLYLVGLCQTTRTESTMQDIPSINAALDALSDQTGQPRNHVIVFDDSRYPSY